MTSLGMATLHDVTTLALQVWEHQNITIPGSGMPLVICILPGDNLCVGETDTPTAVL